MSFIHSSEVWCWMMNSISSWCDERGLLRGEQAVEAEVAAVGGVGGQVGDEFVGFCSSLAMARL